MLENGLGLWAILLSKGNQYFSCIPVIFSAELSCHFCVYLLKVKISEKSSVLEEAEKKIAELTSKVEEQQKLILKLEDDILKVCSPCSCDISHIASRSYCPLNIYNSYRSMSSAYMVTLNSATV